MTLNEVGGKNAYVPSLDNTHEERCLKVLDISLGGHMFGSIIQRVTDIE